MEHGAEPQQLGSFGFGKGKQFRCFAVPRRVFRNKFEEFNATLCVAFRAFGGDQMQGVRVK